MTQQVFSNHLSYPSTLPQCYPSITLMVKHRDVWAALKLQLFLRFRKIIEGICKPTLHTLPAKDSTQRVWTQVSSTQNMKVRFQRHVQTTYSEEKKNLSTSRSFKNPIERTGSRKDFECFYFACYPLSFSTANFEHNRFFLFPIPY